MLFRVMNRSSAAFRRVANAQRTLGFSTARSARCRQHSHRSRAASLQLLLLLLLAEWSFGRATYKRWIGDQLFKKRETLRSEWLNAPRPIAFVSAWLTPRASQARFLSVTQTYT